MGRFIRFLAFSDIRQAAIFACAFFGGGALCRLFISNGSFSEALLIHIPGGIVFFAGSVIMSARRNKRKEEHRKNIELIKKINPSKSRARSFCERDGNIFENHCSADRG